MDKQQIIALLDKYEAGTCTDEEKALLETWYLRWEPEHRPHPTEELVENAVDRVWERLQASVKLQEDATAGNETEGLVWRHLQAPTKQQELTRQKRGRSGRLYQRSAAAACIALMAFFSFWWMWNEFKFSPFVRLMTVQADARMHKTILPDGSIIWLKPGAIVEYPASFGSLRRVSLRGEALFEVAKDPKHPFIVSVGDYIATVLGTSFYIKQSDNRRDMELAVLTGKVKIATKKGPATGDLILLPNQKVLTGASLEVKQVTEKESREYISGTGYDMNFRDTPFPIVIARIERKFNVQIRMGAEHYSSCRFTADLTGQGLEYTLKFIAASAGADYQINENMVLLKGGGCK